MRKIVFLDRRSSAALDVSRNWVSDALSALAEAACDRRFGGYVERFDWSGAALDPGFKRVRVTGRQAYVFAQAALGGIGGADAAARHGIDFLKNRCRRDDGQFVSRLTGAGDVLDATADLYDIAFGIFGLAWWYRLSDDREALAIAEASIAHLTQVMRSPCGRGFLAREADTGPYQQNPHMHLFEASIFLAAFADSAAARQLADHLFDLASSSLFDAETGTLPEFFDQRWRPDDRSGPIRVEPGHHYEWVWLLCRYGDLANCDAAYAIADRLFAFARAHGHDPATGLVVDAVDPSGRLLAGDLRIWPNTEYLKAQVAMRERYGEGGGFDDEALVQNLASIVKYFLTPTAFGPASALPRGLWIDYLQSPSLELKCDHIPASTLYHIMFGFSEVLRHAAGHAPFSGKPW